MKTIKVSDIKVPKVFSSSKPRQEKIDVVKNYVLKNGKLDKPIVLYDGAIVENYIRYLVAVELGMEEVPYITTQEYSKENDINLRLSMSYIIGKFYKCDKEYVWKNPKNIPVDVGDQVLVHSKDKYKKKSDRKVVTVVGTFRSDNKKYLRHKSMIRIVSKGSNNVEKEV